MSSNFFKLKKNLSLIFFSEAGLFKQLFKNPVRHLHRSLTYLPHSLNKSISLLKIIMIVLKNNRKNDGVNEAGSLVKSNLARGYAQQGIKIVI